MCGRYVIASEKKIYELYKIEINSNYNVVPGSYVPILNNNLNPKILKWNFSPVWSKKDMKIVNARNETLHSKPSFKESLRCILIADGYFEWKKTSTSKVPYYFHFLNNLIYFAGIYNKNSGCCIVTRESHKRISHIHHRQPIILKKKDFENWLNYDYYNDNCNSNNLITHRVSKIINNPLNNSFDNIKKIEHE